MNEDEENDDIRQSLLFTEACAKYPKVPDLADVIEWKSAELGNASEFYLGLQNAIKRFLQNPPIGFGFTTGRSVMAAWHLRDLVDPERREPNPWRSPAINTLDVIANSIGLWRIWLCGCGRPLHLHEITLSQKGTYKKGNETISGFKIKPSFVYALDCGRFFIASDWFMETRDMPYPASPATISQTFSLARKVSGEWLWRCLYEYYAAKSKPLATRTIAVPQFVSDYFSKSQKLCRPEASQGKLVYYHPGNQAGEVISTAVTYIERELERYRKAGITGAGGGIMRYNDNMVFAVA